MSPRPDILITAGPYQFLAHFESAAAPNTVAAFRALLPYQQKIIHTRWSGEGMWIPLGSYDFGGKLGYENHTSHPAPGHILLYPAGGISETEILFAYGGVCFACKMGQLAANHFLTITEGLEHVRKLGEAVLWEGAKGIVFEAATDDM